MYGGYMGKSLRINLSTGDISEVKFDETTLRKFIGGSGLGAKILYEETTAETDPLGPDNKLIFMTGPLVGTRVPTSGRHAVVAKSPLTGIWGESDVGGSWGDALKRAGYDGLIIEGKAKEPVYISINNDNVEIRNAAIAWGKDTYETNDVIRAETDVEAEVMCCGPAGEKLVKMAGIFTDGKDARTAGRCGMGAVMGSKLLKAIAVSGSNEVPVADPEGLKASIKKYVPDIVKTAEALKDFGTVGSIVPTEEVGDLPLKNWVDGSWPEGAHNLSGQSIVEKGYLVKNYYCKACVIGCGRVVKLEQGKYAPVDGAGPEFETAGALGGYCLIDDLEGILKATELCNRYGIDTISVGGVVALGMELFEKGIINGKDTGGIELKWGDVDSLIAMIELIGKNEGFGAILGQGTRAMAEQIDDTTSDYAIHTKGLELPAHDPRAFFSLAVGYATSNRGGCHLSAYSDSAEKAVIMPELGWDKVYDRFAVEGKGELTAIMGNLCSLFDSLKVCKFLLWGGVRANYLLEWTNYVTGWDMDLDEFMEAGERMFNLKRLYNTRLGLSRKDDKLPMRVLKQVRGSGGAPTQLPPLNTMLDEYYKYRGWTEDGIPSEDTLKRLGLNHYAQ